MHQLLLIYPKISQVHCLLMRGSIMYCFIYQLQDDIKKSLLLANIVHKLFFKYNISMKLTSSMKEKSCYTLETTYLIYDKL